MVRDALLGASQLDLLHHRAQPLAQQHPEFAFRTIAKRQNPSGYIVETVQAVFQALFDTESIEECLVDVVNRGGDADTTGAIAGMLAGALYGPAGIPWRWLHKLNAATRHACEMQALELLQTGKCDLGISDLGISDTA